MNRNLTIVKVTQVSGKDYSEEKSVGIDCACNELLHLVLILEALRKRHNLHCFPHPTPFDIDRECGVLAMTALARVVVGQRECSQLFGRKRPDHALERHSGSDKLPSPRLRASVRDQHIVHRHKATRLTINAGKSCCNVIGS
jgi:hypothetical protein